MVTTGLQGKVVAVAQAWFGLVRNPEVDWPLLVVLIGAEALAVESILVEKAIESPVAPGPGTVAWVVEWVAGTGG